MRWGAVLMAAGSLGTLFWVITVARSNAQSVAATFGEYTAFWIVFGLLAVIYAGVRLWARGLRALLKQARENRGRLCVRCHYPLVDLEDKGKCPECGHPYEIGQVLLAWRLRDPEIGKSWDGTVGEEAGRTR